MPRILPQLAVDVSDKQRFPLMAFPKIDGVRGCRLEGDGLHGRSMDPFKNSALSGMFSDPVYSGMDGEITINGWLTGFDVPEGETLCSLTTGLCNRAKIKKGETALPTNAVWNVFDFLHPDVVHLPYMQRWDALRRAVEEYTPAGVVLVPWRWVNDAAEARAFEIEMLDLGYEGAIFRDPNALHKSGRATERGNDFWRFKPVSDKDAVVLSIEEADQNTNEAKTNSLGRTERSTSKAGLIGKGMIGTLICRDVETGATIRVGAGCMNHTQRVDWFINQNEIVGHPIKYRSLDTGVLNAPRQARFITRRPLSDLVAA